jgi:hypothetical protein
MHIHLRLLLYNRLVAQKVCPMHGLSFSNELISQYKGLHCYCDCACLLYSKSINFLPKACIIDIDQQYSGIKVKFVVVYTLPLCQTHWTEPRAMMCNYISISSVSTACWLLAMPKFEICSLFKWMKMISLQVCHAEQLWSLFMVAFWTMFPRPCRSG